MKSPRKRGGNATSGYHREGPLIFPLTLKALDEFADVNELFELLRNESKVRKMPDSLSLYEMIWKPNKMFWSNARLRCKICGVNINFIRRNNRVRITKVDVTHTHSYPGEISTECTKTPTSEEFIPKSEIKTEAFEPFQHSESQFPIEDPIETEQLKQNVPGQREAVHAEFSALSIWFSLNGVQNEVRWGKSADRKFPVTVVAADQHMKQNYSRYRDLLCLSIINVVEGYKAALFGIVDSNNRILLVGAALFAEQTYECLFEVFKAFFSIHKATPITILTENIEYVINALNSVKQQGIFLGKHILSPMQALRTETEALEGSSFELACINSAIANAVVVRDREEFEDALRLLLDNPISKDLIPNLTEAKQSIFYCCTDDTFVGLTRNCCQKLHHLADSHFKQQLGLLGFFHKCVLLNATLTAKYTSSFEQYDMEVGLCLGDMRLVELTKECEKEVMERFIENYLKGIRNFTLVGDETDVRDASGIVTAQSKTGTMYQITNSECQCLEFEKTGVACPHLILLAIKCPEKRYQQLISQRWKKSLQL